LIVQPSRPDGRLGCAGWNAWVDETITSDAAREHPRQTAARNTVEVTMRMPGLPGQVVGYYIAMDPLTGQRKWQVPLTDIPSSAGMLVAGGGLVFTGKLTGEFLALDEDNGQTLWQFQTSSSCWQPHSRVAARAQSRRGGAAVGVGPNRPITSTPICRPARVFKAHFRLAGSPLPGGS
jgi:outer membrane protein assembly factor BamB